MPKILKNIYARCYIKFKCARWRGIVWNKTHTWELEYKSRQRGDHSGIRVRRIHGNLNSFLLCESILKGLSG